MTSSSNILWEEELKDMESGSLALPLQCHPSVEAHYNVSVFITVSIYVKSQFQSYYAIFVFFLWYRSGLLTLGLLRTSGSRLEKRKTYGLRKLRSRLSSSVQTVIWVPSTLALYSCSKLAGADRISAQPGTLCRQRWVCCQVIHPASTHKQLVV